MTFLGSIQGCIRKDRIRNNRIGQKLNIRPITQHKELYMEKWVDGTTRMQNNIVAKQVSTGRQKVVGRPRMVKPEQAKS